MEQKTCQLNGRPKGRVELAMVAMNFGQLGEQGEYGLNVGKISICLLAVYGAAETSTES